MANLTRSAKSGSDWTDNDLMAYNITISSTPPEKFFSTPDPSLDHIDPAILDAPPGDDNPDLSDATAEYLGYLDYATRPSQECFIVDFAAETLELLGFNKRPTPTGVHRRYTIPLVICGEANHVAQTDVCLIHRPTLILLVLIEGKTLTNGVNAEAQAVAGAVAAVQFNNGKRRDHGLGCLDVMTIPCIVMAGTHPTFYLVPVTTELSDSVMTGQYPATRTRVLRCVTIATHAQYAGAGMENVEYRKLALKRLLAFRTLARVHWASILEGLS